MLTDPSTGSLRKSSTCPHNLDSLASPTRRQRRPRTPLSPSPPRPRTRPSLPTETRPVRALPATRIAVVIPVSDAPRRTKSTRFAPPRASLPRPRKRGRAITPPRVDVAPDSPPARKKRCNALPTPAPTSPVVDASGASSSGSEDELILKPTDAYRASAAVDAPHLPSPRSSQPDISSRPASGRRLKNKHSLTLRKPIQTPRKPVKSNPCPHTAPAARYLSPHDEESRSTSRDRSISPSPGAGRSHARQLFSGQCSPSRQATRRPKHAPSAHRSSPPALETPATDAEKVDPLLAEIQARIPAGTAQCALPMLHGRAGMAGRETFGQSYVSEVDSLCLKAVESVVQSDDGSDDESCADEEIAQTLFAARQSPRRLSSVSPVDKPCASSGATMLAARASPARRPAARSALKHDGSPKANASKLAQARDTAPTVSKITNVHSSEAVLPALHRLLVHLSGSKPLPIQLPGMAHAADTGTPALEAVQRLADETPCLVGLEDVEAELRSMLVRTVAENEGNALLLCGPRGTGKTAVVARSLALLSDERVYGPNGFITIKLNGLVHSNDKLALKEMARQLVAALNDQGRKREIDSLLDEDDCSAEDESELGAAHETRFMNYGETLKGLMEMLEPRGEADGRRSRALVVVLEEFDRFAELDRQAFLYCLLDVVQGNKRRGGMCVIGTTAAVDCLDRLEKRVKSRCQSRIRYLGAPKVEADRLELLKSVLEISEPEAGKGTFVGRWNEDVDRFLGDQRLRDWVKGKFELQAEAVVSILEELNGMVSMVAYDVKRTGALKFPALNAASLFRAPAGRARSLPWWTHELSTLELAVLVGCKHLSAIQHHGIFNLEMCWDGYRQHLKRIALGPHQPDGPLGAPKGGVRGATDGAGPVRSQVYGRDAFEMGWERLLKLELLLPIDVLNGVHGKPKGKKQAGRKRFEWVKLVPFLSLVERVVGEERVEVARHVKRWCKNWSD